MSGHSKWANIKHKKEAKDAKKGAIFTKLVNQIMLASKHGGKDVETNLKLRLAIEKAKSAGMPKDNIERAIKKGAGELEGTIIEEKTFEAYGPDGVAIIISVVTDNTNRTISEIRNILSKNKGKLAESGSVMYQFKKEGVIKVETEPKETQEKILELIDLGAEDVSEKESGVLEIKISPENFSDLENEIIKKGHKIKESEIKLTPVNAVKTEKTENIDSLLSELESLDDISEITTNLA